MGHEVNFGHHRFDPADGAAVGRPARGQASRPGRPPSWRRSSSAPGSWSRETSCSGRCGGTRSSVMRRSRRASRSSAGRSPMTPGARASSRRGTAGGTGSSLACFAGRSSGCPCRRRRASEASPAGRGPGPRAGRAARVPGAGHERGPADRLRDRRARDREDDARSSCSWRRRRWRSASHRAGSMHRDPRRGRGLPAAPGSHDPPVPRAGRAADRPPAPPARSDVAHPDAVGPERLGAENARRQTSGVTRERMLRELAEAVEVMARGCPPGALARGPPLERPSTVDWLGYLARRPGPARLLVLGSCRPSRRRPASIRSRRSRTS